MDGYAVAFHRLHGSSGATPKSIAWSQGHREGNNEVKKNSKWHSITHPGYNSNATSCKHWLNPFSFNRSLFLLLTKESSYLSATFKKWVDILQNEKLEESNSLIYINYTHTHRANKFFEVRKNIGDIRKLFRRTWSPMITKFHTSLRAKSFYVPFV